MQLKDGWPSCVCHPTPKKRQSSRGEARLFNLSSTPNHSAKTKTPSTPTPTLPVNVTARQFIVLCFQHLSSTSRTIISFVGDEIRIALTKALIKTTTSPFIHCHRGAIPTEWQAAMSRLSACHMRSRTMLHSLSSNRPHLRHPDHKHQVKR